MTGGGLTVRGLTVLDHGHAVVQALDGDVEPGQRLAVVGGAASGAATLLQVLTGGRAPDAGTVQRVRGIGGAPGSRSAARAAREGAAPAGSSHSRHREVGYVPQGHQLLGALTAVENVALVLVAAGVAPEPAWRRAEEQLAALGLPPGSWHNLTEELSGGQQQRVSVARALIDQPGILIADDPTSDLDATSAALVLAGFDHAVRAGSCLVIATNEPAIVETCDLVWRL